IEGRSGEQCDVYEKGCRAPVPVDAGALTDEAASVLETAPAKEQGCTACSAGGSSIKTQAIVLGVLLIVSFIVKFPVFCLICPIGLVFGSLWAVNRVFVLLEPGWELIIFPLMLIAELFLFKRWCSAICPLGFFFTLMAKARTKLGFDVKPQVNCSTCISREGCTTCSTVCSENIDVAS
ncbi:MAG: 4Fe-4S binding protein, partial [Raoultibacter sp.]